MKFRSSRTEVLEDLPIHDAVVKSVSMDWTSGELRIVLKPVGPEELAVLAFAGLLSVEIPRSMPWGPSSSLNAARTVAPSEYVLELQSGDNWMIRADSWSYGFPLQGEA